MDKDMLLKFGDYLTGRGSSNHTISAYCHDVSDFLTFLENMPIDFLSDITPHTAEKYTDELFSSGLGVATCLRRMSGIQTFIYWLCDQGILDSNPFLWIERPAVSPAVPDYLSIEEVGKLLDAPSKSTFIGKRDRVILDLLYSTGIKVGELLRLNLADVDLPQQLLYVRGKKERVLTLGTASCKLLRKYIAVRNEVGPKVHEQGLFLSCRGNRIADATTVRRRVIAYESAVGKNVSPGTLRHSFTVHIASIGITLQELQQLRGETGFESTWQYIKRFKGEAGKFELASIRKVRQTGE